MAGYGSNNKYSFPGGLKATDKGARKTSLKQKNSEFFYLSWVWSEIDDQIIYQAMQ